MSFSFQDRKSNIQKLQNETFDIAIIGGGISGVGVARDAASRGMKVALIEANDFASGTSSRSSKLIHGGIRYLENLEFGLVFEALSERRNLFEIAPHLVHPLRFVLPVYKNARVGMFKLGLGMWLYDILAAFEMPELHDRLNVPKSLAHLPILNPHDLAGSYIYSDAYMDDDRLVIETLRSAVGLGATCANYVKATGAEFESGKLKKLVCKNSLSGETISISARHFVSTVGPWTDLLAHEIFGEWKNIMRPSKGVHLTFSRKRLAIKDAVVMVSDDEKRIVFAIPRHEMVIVGTTDTDFQGDPANVHTEREDVDYLLRIANEYFPGAELKEKDIIASYSGVRPLVHDHAESESKTSREHLIFSDERNVTFLTGGKYTTFRKMAEDTMLAVLNNFALEEQVKWARNQTLQPLNALATSETIAQAHAQTATWAKDSGLDVDTVHFLVERHGAEAQVIINKFVKQIKCEPKNARWHFEALHAIHETMCLNLVDFYLRRVPLFLAREDHGFLLLNELAEIFKKIYSWTEEQKIDSVNAVRKHLEFEMGWCKSP